ncbi:MAG: GNAT family N-acetyltransferase [Chloroflexi bacterium]|nr:GNAT family N-acetyltransferase [Chloroflexota bacterium]
MEERRNGYLLSTDLALWDAAAIHAALTASYWAAGVPLDVVTRSLTHSLGVGAYLDPTDGGSPGPSGASDQAGVAGRRPGDPGQAAEAQAGVAGRRPEQVGFVRVVTDRATFAWVCDVYVLPAHRGRALGKRMMAMLMAHPELQGLRRWMLATRDAHGLYAQFGFEPLPVPSRFMQLPNRSDYGGERPTERRGSPPSSAGR